MEDMFLPNIVLVVNDKNNDNFAIFQDDDVAPVPPELFYTTK